MAADLDTIRTKVRRLTRTPSTNQLSDATIDDYINTFVLYDFPEHLRLFSFKKTFSFYSEPYVDVYETDTATPTAPLFNFKNKYITVHPPIYVAGYPVWYSQSRAQFFAMYPLTNSIKSIGTTGDGVTTAFNGTLAGITTGSVIVRNHVVVSSIATNGDAITLIDDPQDATTGNLVVPNDTSTGNALGTINYVTGAFTLNFPTPPGSGEDINFEILVKATARPQGILYYDNKFTLRPVPDQSYKITMDVYERPTDLINDGDEPELEQYWQYIAYGAARKVFQDRMDMDSLALIEPEYKKQEQLVLRRTIVQQSNQRTSTIYTTTLGGPGLYGSGFFEGGGNF